ncbi:DUF1501 domain-containing protein [Pseudoduganella sp. UC29_106]|uniref:DUF1501 domain-containing protein n=1 Tax=Pseudoduganella sp. UC29_106 TaxID=3374553 RepID=UPI003757143D
MKSEQFSRRRFLGAMLSAAGTSAAPFAMNLAAIGPALAATSDYKALVCIFLHGGNDHYNTVLATDPTSWNTYNSLRNTGDLGSIHLASVGQSSGILPINPATPQSGRSFALHPQLGSLKALFDAGRAAVVSNVGTLVAPITLSQYKAGANVPPKLFSHNDQQSMWQSSAPEGASYGWGGRIGDLLASANSNATFTCISAAGNAVFVSGRQIRQYQISNSGAVPVAHMDDYMFGTWTNPTRAIVTASSGNMMAQEYANVVKRSLDSQATLSTGMAASGSGGVPVPSKYTNPKTGQAEVNPLAVQLQTVARVIAGRGTLGAKRQVFFVQMGGFDTHDGQKVNHAVLMAKLNHALAWFDGALSNLMGSDLRNSVTAFTASDFGRTLTSNGDGTDHGWGSHHFVVGGAVRGKNIYGSFPTVGLNHSLDVGQGALLPQISVEQYGGTLATWFGLGAAGLADVFPTLYRYSDQNLGFMG